MCLCIMMWCCRVFFFFASRRRHTRFDCDWSSDVCSSDLFVLGISFLLLALPFMVAVALLIRIGSPGPAIIRQSRVGRGGLGFAMLKFRTMRQGADEDLEDVLTRDPELRLTWQQFQKLVHDPRLTPVGRGLRRHSVDEPPHLWNVGRGEMSLVGARPFPPATPAAH